MTMFEKSVRISTEKEIEPDDNSPSPTSESGSGTTAVDSPTSPSQCPQCCQAKDPEKDRNQPLHGWPELAKRIAETPDFEAFQSFKDLNIKSLLYYQVELDKLRMDLHRIEWKNHREGQFPDAQELGKHAGLLLGCKSSQDKEERKQIDLIVKIREVLKEYSKMIRIRLSFPLRFCLLICWKTDDAMLQYAQISSLPKAHRLNVNSLRTWLSHSNRGNIYIQGPGAHTWGDLTQDEPKKLPLKQQFLSLLCSLVWAKKPEKDELGLIVPCAGREVDGLTRWVANEFVPFWQNLRDAYRKRNDPVPEDEGDTSSVTSEKSHSSRSKSKRYCGILPFVEPPKQSQNKPAEEHIHQEDETETDKIEPTLNTYTEDRMLRFTSSIATVIACLLPTLAIAVLAKLHETGELLGLIAVFTAIFAIGLMFLTNSGTSRVEIFTATAA